MTPPEGKYYTIYEDINVPLQVTCDSPTNHIEMLHSTLATSDLLVVTTHVFSFLSREEHDWQPRLMLLKHQPGS